MDSPIRLKFTFAELPAELNTPFDPYKPGLSRAWLQDEIITVTEQDKYITIPRRLSFRYVKIELLGVSGYFDFAEIQAMRKNPIYMSDYVNQLDSILSSTGEKLLTDGGKISHEQAMEKAMTEYRKYQKKTLTEVEQTYLETIKMLSKNDK